MTLFKLLAARAAGLALKIPELLTRSLRKIAAGRSAEFGKDAIVFAEARIINTGNDPSRIRIGNCSRLRGELFVFAHAGQIEIGDWFYCGPGSKIWSSDTAGIKIGHRVLIAANVLVLDTNSHPMDPKERFEQTKAIFGHGHPQDINGIDAAPVIIGDDVWIATGSKILKGVTIGDRAIIGAGAIISKDVPPDTLIPAGTVFAKETQ